MASGNCFGELFKVCTFGESHGAALGVVIDGVPSGLTIDEKFIAEEMELRRPGRGAGATSRNESDRVEILSGTFGGVSTGASLAMLIRNSDQRSGDYEEFKECFRPGHADYGWFKKFGCRDHRGGGRSSGRETAARVAAGAVAKLLLAHYGVEVHGCVMQIGAEKCEIFDAACSRLDPMRAGRREAGERMLKAVQVAAAGKDSLGGMVECRVSGLPAGLGDPVFDKLNALIAHAVFSIGAVRGLEFGAGFAVAGLTGSENNDPMDASGFTANHAGGVLGGISTGEELVFRVAVKPTPSIAKEQSTLDIGGNERVIVARGRHDHCIVPRVVPVIEAMSAITLADLWLRRRADTIR